MKLTVLRILGIISLTLNLCFAQGQYQTVILNGRVIDPETKLDAVRNIGINDGKIARITSETISGTQTISAQGLVVSPGFIDLHIHGVDNDAREYQIHDGVTTALELEGGIPFIKYWLKSKEGKSLNNYGASAPQSVYRMLAMDDLEGINEKIVDIISKEGLESENLQALFAIGAKKEYESLTTEELKKMRTLLDVELHSGAIGIGVPVAYYPGANAEEVFDVYKYAAEKNEVIFTHTRGFGIQGIQEAISSAAASGASLHIVHANSVSLSEINVTLDMVASAQKHGLDITAEVYPYTAASTGLGSALFDEGWQQELGISYGDLQWEATGERLTEETFKKYRETGGTVIIHMMKPEWIMKGVASPVTMIASDGMPYAPMAHPRTAGTFSRVLGRYVREQKALDLMTALAKMTIMPAQRLSKIAPSANNKGRLQEGKDADITIFDPNIVLDLADFTGLKFSTGIEYVFVNGTMVLREGKTVENVFPGKAVLGN